LLVEIVRYAIGKGGRQRKRKQDIGKEGKHKLGVKDKYKKVEDKINIIFMVQLYKSYFLT
jgi:hypothetical protein